MLTPAPLSVTTRWNPSEGRKLTTVWLLFSITVSQVSFTCVCNHPG